MHITVYCPHCRSRYQVEPELRGKRMRCPNNLCREVFEVREDEPAPIPIEAGAKEAERPSIQDAEIVGEAPASPGPGEPEKAVTAHIAEPVVEPSLPSVESAPKAFFLPSESMRELISWETAPPVRRSPAAEVLSGSFLTPSDIELIGTSELAEDDPVESSTRARQALWMIGFMVVLIGLIVVSVTITLLNTLVKREGEDYAEAAKQYSNGKYAVAAQAYRDLIQAYPKSPDLPRYRFFGDLSELRSAVEGAQEDPRQAVSQVQQFTDDYRSDPLLRENRAELRKSVRSLAGYAADYSGAHGDVKLFEESRKLLELAHKYTTDEDAPESDHDILEKIDLAQAAIQRQQLRQSILDRLAKGMKGGSSKRELVEVRELASRGGVLADADIAAALGEFEKALRSQIRFVANPSPAQLKSPAFVESSLVLTPSLVAAKGADSRPVSGEPAQTVLALARGVLYALDEESGELRWVTRVGVDTTQLPVRLPRTSASPDLFLVLSADRNLLMALRADDGELYWQQELTAPCLGRPVVVGRQAYVPTYDGRVYEIEIIAGNVLGYFELGQPLTTGGAHEEGTDLLYFPGESENLYVLDSAPPGSGRSKGCVAILHTGHPAGSLRSEPIIVCRPDPFAPGGAPSPAWPNCLILSQTDGLDHMILRVFRLPITGSHPPPLMEPDPRVRGWSWFRPYHDQEKLAFVTDAGIFGLFGLNQVRNDDRQLFSEFREEHRMGEAKVRIGRAQVVHAVENSFWIIADGELQRLQFDVYGQKQLPLWAAPVKLGSPLHASQSDKTGKRICVVTEDLERRICLATSVDAESGRIVWQRLLGVEAHGDPIVLGQQMVLADQSGALFILGREKKTVRAGRISWWQPGFALSPPFSARAQSVGLITSADGKSVYEFANDLGSSRLIVRRFQDGPVGSESKVDEGSIELPAPPAGSPAPGPDSLLIPLADGTIQRLGLPLDGKPGEGGPNWRANRADEGAAAHILSLNANEFLTTDGSRGITHWQWQSGQKDFRSLPAGRRPTVELPARIISRPVALPANAAGERGVCVADAEGTLTLLRGDDLRSERSWSLGGKITAGPFERQGQIGCIVDRRRLVWIDPTKENRLWEYTAPGEGIVGQPELVHGFVLVADLSGSFVALDPKNGRRAGEPYQIKSSATAASTPVAYGANEACVPLTDGTIFLLPDSLLRNIQ